MNTEIKSKLATKGNLALFEYPTVHESEFEIDKKGVLFIFGYKIKVGDNEIRVAKRFELGIKNYTVIGRYNYAKGIVIGDLDSFATEAGVDRSNCLVLIKTETIDEP